MYLGAIASAGIIGVTYGPQATTAGLHRLGVILTITLVAALVSVPLDRDLR